MLNFAAVARIFPFIIFFFRFGSVSIACAQTISSSFCFFHFLSRTRAIIIIIRIIIMEREEKMCEKSCISVFIRCFRQVLRRIVRIRRWTARMRHMKISWAINRDGRKSTAIHFTRSQLFRCVFFFVPFCFMCSMAKLLSPPRWKMIKFAQRKKFFAMMQLWALHLNEKFHLYLIKAAPGAARVEAWCKEHQLFVLQIHKEQRNCRRVWD